MSPDGSTRPDGAADSSTGTDAPGFETGVDAGPPPPPQGTLLASAQGAFLLTVTSDGYAVYADTSGALYAISTAGASSDAGAADAGAPIPIATGLTQNGIVGSSGKVVFTWPALSASSPVGTLTVWSAATGAHSVTNTYSGVGAASGDGTKIVYATSNAAGSVGDVTGANADLTSPSVLVSQAALGGNAAVDGGATDCAPSIAFAGAGQTDALVAYCLPDDGGGNTATLDAFSGTSWTKAPLAANLRPLTPSTFSLSPDFAEIMAVTTGNEIEAISYPGGTVSPLEASGQFPGFFIGTGASLAAVYTTQSGNQAAAVHESPVATPSATALVPSGVLGIFGAPSPDQSWGIYVTSSASALQGALNTSNLFLFGTAIPSTTKTVDTTADAFFFGPAFTTDSTHALYFNSASTVGNLGIVGSLEAYSISAGTTTPVAGNVWQESTSTGATVIYNDSSRAVDNGNDVIADIEAVDLSVSPLAPKTIQGGAETSFFLTPDLKSVIYTYAQGTTAQNGVYVVSAE